MRCFLVLICIFITNYSVAQNKNLLLLKKYFDKELKEWTSSFNNFKLSDFKKADTLKFENIQEKDFNHYKAFLNIYKPIVTYSQDGSQFIDIYSYQLNLEKKGSSYQANVEIDQAVFLCNSKKKYWDIIWFGGSERWIDEVIWTSKTKFLLVGITKREDERKSPLILRVPDKLTMSCRSKLTTYFAGEDL